MVELSALGFVPYDSQCKPDLFCSKFSTEIVFAVLDVVGGVLLPLWVVFSGKTGGGSGGFEGGCVGIGFALLDSIQSSGSEFHGLSEVQVRVVLWGPQVRDWCSAARFPRWKNQKSRASEIPPQGFLGLLRSMAVVPSSNSD
ncbi:hypothetical protein Fot_28042 [Forsythia ovata]|uniref:Uncharacterized protein n=1 Tax=Forsythia ovata TaxID=205694 RepID=A0ABD1TMZ6_9LAMI